MAEINLAELSDTELDSLFENVKTEVSRRVILDNAEARQSELNQQVLAAEGIKFGDDWRQPTGAHDAYSKNWESKHKNKDWISLLNGNVWEPGVSGWKEKVVEGDVPEWVQPTGAHDAYSFGDKVKHKGKAYLNNHPGNNTNVWEPGAFAGWVEE